MLRASAPSWRGRASATPPRIAATANPEWAAEERPAVELRALGTLLQPDSERVPAVQNDDSLCAAMASLNVARVFDEARAAPCHSVASTDAVWVIARRLVVSPATQRVPAPTSPVRVVARYVVRGPRRAALRTTAPLQWRNDDPETSRLLVCLLSMDSGHVVVHVAANRSNSTRLGPFVCRIPASDSQHCDWVGAVVRHSAGGNGARHLRASVRVHRPTAARPAMCVSDVRFPGTCVNRSARNADGDFFNFVRTPLLARDLYVSRPQGRQQIIRWRAEVWFRLCRTAASGTSYYATDICAPEAAQSRGTSTATKLLPTAC
jgi:hypothetical protein